MIAKMKHYFTNKEDGNLAFHVGDALKSVYANHTQLAYKLGFERDALVHMKQIHSNTVHIVGDEDNFYNPPTCDALVTNKSNIPLMVMVADCTPVLFWTSTPLTCKAIGVAHVGRAGAFGNIVKNVIEMLEAEYGALSQNIVVTLGPSIGVCCYEVGREIVESAKEFHYAFEVRDAKYYLDINKIIVSQLRACKIAEENIINESVCTACHTKTYFSYRKEGSTGRFAGVLLLT